MTAKGTLKDTFPALSSRARGALHQLNLSTKESILAFLINGGLKTNGFYNNGSIQNFGRKTYLELYDYFEIDLRENEEEQSDKLIFKLKNNHRLSASERNFIISLLKSKNLVFKITKEIEANTIKL